MVSAPPLRLSSFFFGRGSGPSPPLPEDLGAADGAAGAGSGGGGSPAGDASLRQPLLGHAEVDLESCHDESFVFSWRRLLLHVGPGALMCIAFVDPGNLEADLQTGAGTGYQLLWVLLWSTTMGGLLQSLAARLGVATGKHLAEHCREQYPPGVRHVLWLMAELAIIGSDIQEVIGTAIALLLLTGGGIPLWGGVLLAAAGAYTMLFLERLGVRWLEALFQALIAVMSVAMGLLFFLVDIPYGEVAKGLAVPSLSRAAIPTACGLLGAIIMPHNLFLHSALVHSREIDGPADGAMPARRSMAAKKESVLYYNIESALALVATLFINVCVISVFARGFFGRKTEEEIGLANAGAYLGATFGRHMSAIWAVGLLAAGQSSTMTGTYAGQFVMGGFLNLKISAGMRTLVTRGVAICPTLLVALSARSDSTKLDSLNQYINILQSVQLPFAVIPLLLLTGDKAVMGARFVNSRATTALCWLIAAGIIGINATTAFDTLAPFMTAGRTWWLQSVFWAGVALYVGFLIYLILTPEGAQQLASTISRNVSRLSLRHGGGGSGASLVAAGAARGPPASTQQSAAASAAGSPPAGSRAAAAAAAAAPPLPGPSLLEQGGGGVEETPAADHSGNTPSGWF
ncbi:hypothetical protein ABPG75_002606 [Micractinium tetrahymenae]